MLTPRGQFALCLAGLAGLAGLALHAASPAALHAAAPRPASGAIVAAGYTAPRLAALPSEPPCATSAALSVTAPPSGTADPALPPDEDPLALPAVGDHRLRVIDPTTLELTMVTTEKPGGRPEAWDFAGSPDPRRLPVPSQFQVTTPLGRIPVTAIGFRRRVIYAPLNVRDLRIGCSLYLRLAAPVPEGALVQVASADGSLWPAALRYAVRLDPRRLSPAIHVNQVGYLPAESKKAMVGYYLGSMGELELSDTTRFSLQDAATGRTVFSGALKPRRDRGWTYTTAPYQQVMEADFSAFRTPGRYRLAVPGFGASYPFRIDEGTAAAFARTYALGLYHQRCGGENALPFTRFVHAPCHTAPAEVPTMENRNAQHQLSGETANYKSNPLHSAPQLKDIASSLYPFVRQGLVDVAGGHHDAGDYSKYTINSAQLIHYLVFAADNFPGVGDLDNLGLPESGDGKSDLLQLAKWEADFLAKMQDDDGGFYFLVYPKNRAYENDVLPDHGDPQIVFPKTTSVTAAAVAALAQTASSPRFKRAFPTAAARYLAAAQSGWAFLERAWARHGRQGAYQKITHYGDTFMDNDEIAWAAAELYLATGNAKFDQELRTRFDPADKETRHWTWERMFEAYGCAIRSYAFAARNGRVTADRLDSGYLTKCRAEIEAAAQDHVDWSSANAYATAFPTETKRFRTAGWYFSTSQAFDIAVAEALDPRPGRMEAILGCIGYEAGCNPTDVVFLTGVGSRRQREIVHHVAMNDRRVLPPSGIPLGSIQEGFMYLEKYGRELGAVTFPPDSLQDAPYPMYDRWGDSFNVATEFTIPIQGRSLATTAWLMARSARGAQPWRTAVARIGGVPARAKVGVPIHCSVTVPGLSTADAQIVWEADGLQPAFGQTFTDTPRKAGRTWIEAEVLWPDGRRVSAAGEFEAAP